MWATVNRGQSRQSVTALFVLLQHRRSRYTPTTTPQPTTSMTNRNDNKWLRSWTGFTIPGLGFCNLGIPLGLRDSSKIWNLHALNHGIHGGRDFLAALQPNYYVHLHCYRLVVGDLLKKKTIRGDSVPETIRSIRFTVFKWLNCDCSMQYRCSLNVKP